MKRIAKLTFFGLLLVLVVLDFVIEKHPHFAWEKWIGFYALFGFIACVSLVFIAKGLRLLIKRGEDYYG